MHAILHQDYVRKMNIVYIKLILLYNCRNRYDMNSCGMQGAILGTGTAS